MLRSDVISMIEKVKAIAEEVVKEYDHGMAEYDDCSGVNREQYTSVLNDFFLYFQGYLETEYTSVLMGGLDLQTQNLDFGDKVECDGCKTLIEKFQYCHNNGYCDDCQEIAEEVVE